MSPSYRFGRCELRPIERLLLIDGAAAELGSRAFDVLLLLVHHAGSLLTKDWLLEKVWGRPVEESNLQTQVSNLRKLIGTSAIVTIPGHGYRFAMVVSTAPASSDIATAGAVAVAEPPAPLSPLPALPTAPTLHGRDDDGAKVLVLLDSHRWLTLLGAGGIGKTALALKLAADWAASTGDPVAWIDLSQATDPARVCSAFAQALQLPLDGADDTAAQTLPRAAAGRRGLLVVDNAEHQTAPTGALLQSLLAAAPALRCLVTSQTPLRQPGEQLFRLRPLSVPPPGTPRDEALRHGALALFADCAAAAGARGAWSDEVYAAAADICRALDGLPLALRLAAARVPLLGVAGVRDRLTDRLRLLVGPSDSAAPTRHRTLQAALDWSHALLPPAEQKVLRRLAVCAGSFTLDLATAVAGDETQDAWAVTDAIGALVDRSFVETATEPAAPPRYRLSDTGRDYAQRQLDAAGETAAVRQRHAEACATALAAAYDALWASADGPWLARWIPELDNVRAALDWAERESPALALGLCGSASLLFMLPGLTAEARRRWIALRGTAEERDASPGDARYWLEGSRLMWGVSTVQMRERAARALRHYRAAGDVRGIYLALRLASVAAEPPAAADMLREMRMLEQPGWPPRLRTQRLLAEAGAARVAGNVEGECAALQQVLHLAAGAGIDTITAFALASLSAAELRRGDTATALRRARELLVGPRTLYGNHVLQALATVAAALLLDGSDIAAAEAAVAEFAELSRHRGGEWFDLQPDLYALLAARLGRLETAARLAGYADARQQAAGGRDAAAARLRSAVAAALQSLDAALAAQLAALGARDDDEAVYGLLFRNGNAL